MTVHKNPLLFAAIKCKDVLEIARGKENARIWHDGFVVFDAPCNSAQETGRECIARNGPFKARTKRHGSGYDVAIWPNLSPGRRQHGVAKRPLNRDGEIIVC